MRVMIVDDSQTMRTLEKRVLDELGHRDVEEAGDGADALRCAAKFHPELILVDWDMPVMDGLAFVRTYREQGHTTPIIMISQESEKSRVIEAIRAGVSNYLMKPFTPEQLSVRVMETLAKCA